MKRVAIITIGKQSDTNLANFEQQYLKRFKTFKLNCFELKTHQENREVEAKEILKKLDTLSPSLPIFLTEKGHQLDSPKFSKWFYRHLEQNSAISFVIGGAAGLDRSLFSLGPQLSLSSLTFPHKLARSILIEQLYRAETINLNHPYHK